MSLIEWDDATLSVGIKHIDNEHKALLNYINELSACLENNLAKEKLTLLFEQLIQYTQNHFASEERYFSQLNLKDLRLHQLQHKHFMEQLHLLKKQNDDHVSQDLLELLLDWLVIHIQCEDMKFIQDNKIPQNK
ncbi:bacteriohemerythrin [Colwellia sp. 1_MG-2023]|uniref:bacteriohemerythrin n=1 Tax=Colwellia sp. 1_MG-2023 TaxID=3062649 RepID=UPI0026E35042|nr:bacteriohemerythrin [Colwellia sp. 1_MG-2023]MDO6444933.1 bacteriohemerythrin [Colwellia sp. 1_MG-2023]